MIHRSKDGWSPEGRIGALGVAADVGGGLVIGLVGVAAGISVSAASAVAGALLGLAWALRRTFLLPAALVGVVAAVVQVVAGDINVVADLAFAGLTHAAGNDPRPAYRRAGLAYAAAGTLGAGIVGLLPGGVGGPRPSGSVGSAVVLAGLAALVLGGGWLTGYVRWQRRAAEWSRVEARVRARLGEAEERRLRDLVAEEQERIRIAADMHDVVAHSWAVVAAQADGARYRLRAGAGAASASGPDGPGPGDGSADAERALEVIGDTARRAMDDVRTLLDRLRVPVAEAVDRPIDRGGAREVVGDEVGLENTGELVERLRAAGMVVEVSREGAPPRTDPASDATRASTVARRVLAESLTNALKHGDLSEPVHIDEHWSGGYLLTVRNAVRSASETARRGDAGHGIRGMRERLAEVGGTLDSGPERDGRHWVLVASIPDPRASAARSEAT